MRVTPTLLFFTSRRDGRSRRAEGYLAQVLQRRRNHDTFSVRKIDLEDRPDLLERFRVSEPPALVVVVDKRVRGRLEKPRSCTEIHQFLESWLR